jgi:hypothetical protein
MNIMRKWPLCHPPNHITHSCSIDPMKCFVTSAENGDVKVWDWSGLQVARFGQREHWPFDGVAMAGPLNKEGVAKRSQSLSVNHTFEGSDQEQEPEVLDGNLEPVDYGPSYISTHPAYNPEQLAKFSKDGVHARPSSRALFLSLSLFLCLFLPVCVLNISREKRLQVRETTFCCSLRGSRSTLACTMTPPRRSPVAGSRKRRPPSLGPPRAAPRGVRVETGSSVRAERQAAEARPPCPPPHLPKPNGSPRAAPQRRELHSPPPPLSSWPREKATGWPPPKVHPRLNLPRKPLQNPRCLVVKQPNARLTHAPPRLAMPLRPFCLIQVFLLPVAPTARSARLRTPKYEQQTNKQTVCVTGVTGQTPQIALYMQAASSASRPGRRKLTFYFLLYIVVKVTGLLRRVETRLYSPARPVSRPCRPPLLFFFF